jgi:transglutaminase-like putative cysteine protease
MRKTQIIAVFITALMGIYVSCAPVPGEPAPAASINPFQLYILSCSSNMIGFSWTSTNGATGYILSYSTSSNGTFSELYSGSGLSYSQYGLSPDTTYYYKLSASFGGTEYSLPMYAMRTMPVQMTFGGVTVNGFISNLTAGQMKTYSIYAKNVKITSGTVSNFVADSYFTITGTNYSVDYPRLAISIQSPDLSNTMWYYIDSKGYFEQKIFMRYGAGTYTVKVLNGPHPDGYWYVAAVMWAVNSRTNDFRYLMPSGMVQSLDPRIRALAFQLAGAVSVISNKARIIHDYIVKSIYYDLEVLNGVDKPMDAVSCYLRGSAVCAGYSFYYAALLRALDIPAMYVRGMAGGSTTINHAWNEVYWGGSWHIVDTTWDDPLINGHSDYPDGYNLRWKYFDIPEVLFHDDHTNESPVAYYSLDIPGEEGEY